MLFISENWNADEIPYHDFVAAGNIVSEYVLDNPVTQINGYIGIWDFKGFTLKQFIPFCSLKNIALLQQLMQVKTEFWTSASVLGAHTTERDSDD